MISKFLQRRTKNYKRVDGFPDPAEYFKSSRVQYFPFFEDENASGLYGFGHQDKTYFAGKANEYYAGEFPIEEAYTEENVEHTWGVLYKIIGREDEMDPMFMYGDDWSKYNEKITAYKDRLFSESFKMTVITF